MKKESSVTRTLKEVPLYAERYENFLKRLENQGVSESTIRNYGYNLAVICLEYVRLPEPITDDEYVEYYNKLLKRKSSGPICSGYNSGSESFSSLLAYTIPVS